MILTRAALFSLLLCAPLAAQAADEPAAPSCPAKPDLSATPYAAWAGPDGERAAPGNPLTLTMTDGKAERIMQVDTAGRYGVAADGRVWIDLIAKGAPLKSVDHGHGPACSGIRKIVWFDLPAGEVILSLTKADSARVRVLLVRAP